MAQDSSGYAGQLRITGLGELPSGKSRPRISRKGLQRARDCVTSLSTTTTILIAKWSTPRFNPTSRTIIPISSIFGPLWREVATASSPFPGAEPALIPSLFWKNIVQVAPRAQKPAHRIPHRPHSASPLAARTPLLLNMVRHFACRIACPLIQSSS